MQPRRRGAGHLGERGVGDIRCARKFSGAEIVGLNVEPGDLVCRHAAQNGLCTFRHGLDDDQVAEALQQILDEAARIMAGLDDAVHCAEHGGCVGRGNSLHDVIQQGGMRIAQEGNGKLIVQAAWPRTRHQLVQDGQGVPDGAGACSNDQGQHTGCHRHVLLLAQEFQVGHQGLRRHEPEGVVVGAGPDGADHLVRFRGGENELDVFRRLFHDLEQGVEAG